MNALVTKQGTATTETALCNSCFLYDENTDYAREMASQTDDIDPASEFMNCNENDALNCIICGKNIHEED